MRIFFKNDQKQALLLEKLIIIGQMKHAVECITAFFMS